MGKKVNRAIVLMMAISLLLGSVTAYAAENQEPAIEEVELQAQNASSGRELVDVIDSSVTTYQSDNVITGSINYYYDGMDSQNRPGYTVEATMISSNLNISSSNLMTKAEGVSDWHENEVNHYTGKVAVNTRSYIYTNNPPANPYCEVKLYVTDSKDFEIYIGYTKLQDAMERK